MMKIDTFMLTSMKYALKRNTGTLPEQKNNCKQSKKRANSDMYEKNLQYALICVDLFSLDGL